MIDLSGAKWRKATRSQSGGNACVEVAGVPGTIAVRDSKNPGGAVLAFTPQQWSVFLREVRRGQVDL